MEQNGLSLFLGDGFEWVSNRQRCIIAWMSWGLRFIPGATELRRAAIGRADVSMSDFILCFRLTAAGTSYRLGCCCCRAKFHQQPQLLIHRLNHESVTDRFWDEQIDLCRISSVACGGEACERVNRCGPIVQETKKDTYQVSSFRQTRRPRFEPAALTNGTSSLRAIKPR